MILRFGCSLVGQLGCPKPSRKPIAALSTQRGCTAKVRSVSRPMTSPWRYRSFISATPPDPICSFRYLSVPAPCCSRSIRHPRKSSVGIAQHRPTVLVNVPAAINQMLSHPDAKNQDVSSLRLATSAGEALPESLYRRWKETFGVELLDGLGTAEMWHIFVTNVVGDVRPGTLGKVVPGFEIKACDEDGTEVPSGEVGRLWVRGDSLGLGYFEDPVKTEETFRGEWFVGGDLVSIDNDGYVTHRGRADDAIKVKGKWFRPQEVESVLLEHPSVKEVAVVAVSDEAGLAKPVAFVVPTSSVSEQELIDWVLDHIEAYKHPRRVYLVERLPQTHLGKVDRSELKRRAV